MPLCGDSISQRFSISNKTACTQLSGNALSSRARAQARFLTTLLLLVEIRSSYTVDSVVKTVSIQSTVLPLRIRCGQRLSDLRESSAETTTLFAPLKMAHSYASVDLSMDLAPVRSVASTQLVTVPLTKKRTISLTVLATQPFYGKTKCLFSEELTMTMTNSEICGATTEQITAAERLLHLREMYAPSPAVDTLRSLQETKCSFSEEF